MMLLRMGVLALVLALSGEPGKALEPASHPTQTERMGPVMVSVYWCEKSAPVDTFNPHQLDAGKKFAIANPGMCHVSPPEEIDAAITVEKCRAWQFVYYMPGWLQKNTGKLYLGADCFMRGREPLDMQALKDKVSP